MNKYKIVLVLFVVAAVTSMLLNFFWARTTTYTYREGANEKVQDYVAYQPDIYCSTLPTEKAVTRKGFPITVDTTTRLVGCEGEITNRSYVLRPGYMGNVFVAIVPVIALITLKAAIDNSK